MLTISDAKANLKGFKKAGVNQYKAMCPAHQDHNASLSIMDDDGKAILHCHAGCSYDEIIRAMGLNFSTPSYRPQGERYDYTNIYGELLFRKTRTINKEFYVSHFENGKMIKGMGDIKPVLYNLPAVAAALGVKPVYVVEGEKDANTMKSHGYVATTNCEGATIWKDEYSAILAGAAVVVIPDNDIPGAKHAQVVAESVIKHAISVKIVDLRDIWPEMPDKADISDYIDTHSDLTAAWAAFDELVATTQEYICGVDVLRQKVDISSPSVVDRDDKQVNAFVVNDLIPQGSTVIAGMPKIGKSLLALQISVAVIKGESFLGNRTCENDVLYIVDCVKEVNRTNSRLNKMCGTEKRHILDIQICPEASGIVDYLDKYLSRNPGCGLVVFDPLSMIIMDKNATDTCYAAERKQIDQINKVVYKHGANVLFLHHTCKIKDNRDFVTRVSGSFGISGTVDTIIVLEQDCHSDYKRLIARGRDIAETNAIISLGSDMTWHLINTSNSHSKYETDPLVITLRKLLTDNNDNWSGTASELIVCCMEIAGWSPVGNNATAMSKYIIGLNELLRAVDGVIHKPPAPNGSNGKRLHCFYRAV